MIILIAGATHTGKTLLAQKLLEKELGRGDRQEAEKILSSLRFMQAKGELTPEDNESLNENFNALLKLMAKYSV